MVRRPAFAVCARTAAAWLFVGLSACASSADVGGIWRGTGPIASASNDLLYDVDGGPVAIELVLGDYGPDLAGVVRFWQGDQFLRRRNPNPPDRDCACAFVRLGRVDTATGRGVFALDSCLPGSSPAAVVHLRGELVRTGDADMGLSLRVDDGASALHGGKVAIDLRRAGGAGDVSAADLACPTSLPGGNTASGR